MVLLAIDTSTRKTGLALYDGVQTLCEVSWASANFHTVELAPAVQTALVRAGLGVGDLEALGVALGPGSFTGLRIGLGLAKGLALSRHLPLVGIPTLDVVAAAQPVRAARLVAILQVGRSRLGVGWYTAQGDTWQSEDKLEILTLEALARKLRAPTQVCGELDGDARRRLARKRKNVLLASPAQCLRRPAFLAELAWERWQAGQVDDPATLAPIYLSQGDPLPT